MKKRKCYIGEDGYCHVPLANEKGEAITDAEFIEEINKYNWHIKTNGSSYSKIGEYYIGLDRFVFLLKFKEIKNGYYLSHINMNKLDNRIFNLKPILLSKSNIFKNKKIKRQCYIGEDGCCHIPLANKKGEAICDSEFIEEVSKHNWCLNKKYATSKIGEKFVLLHRFVFYLKFGEVKNEFCLDHADKNPLNNLICNLRKATQQQNMMNRNKFKGNFKGVSFNNEKKKYRAQIRVYGKTKHLGYYKKEEEAAYFYDIAAYHYFNEFAVLNFPGNIEEYKSKKPGYNIADKKKPSSNFIGVSFSKRDKVFRANVKINGITKYIGSHKDEILVAKIRDLYIIKHGLDRKLNFPLETYQNELNQEPKNMVVFKAN